MFSVTYTGMNFFPLCTAIVWPTISGMTVDRRDQVLMTFLSPPRFMPSIFSSSGTSTKGPFFSDLLMYYPSDFSRFAVCGLPTANCQLFRSPSDDEAIGPLRVARLVALGRHAPRRHRVTAARGLAFAAAERVVDRVHRDAAYVRPDALPAAAPGLADRHVLVVDVADRADGRETVHVDLADLAGRHLHRGVVAFLGHQLHRRPGAARDLAALARLQLDVVEQRAERNVLQRQRIARQDVDVLPRDDGVADLQPGRLQDVALLAVGVGQQRDARRAVRVVLDGRDPGRHIELVPLEIDDPVHPLVAAAAPPRGEVSGVVAAAGAADRLQQRLVRFLRRDLVEQRHRLKTGAGRRRLEFAKWHDYAPSRNSGIFAPS